MPRYLVYFEEPVIYRPDHPKSYRRVPVTVLPVHSENARLAEAHALRMTKGGLVARVEEVERFAAPAPVEESTPPPPQKPAYLT